MRAHSRFTGSILTTLAVPGVLALLALGACESHPQIIIPEGFQGAGDRPGPVIDGHAVVDHTLDDLDPGKGGHIDPDAACAYDTWAARPLPVSMLLAVDVSGSMKKNGKWQLVRDALNAFFVAGSAADISVALRTFPDGACNELTCDASACSQPLVDIGPLSLYPQRKALKDALQIILPEGETNLGPALQGAEQWAGKYAAGEGIKGKTVVVLVTDGFPTVCETDIPTIAGYAGAAYEAHDVRTFAIGLSGTEEATLDEIAAAGGTEGGYFIGDMDIANGLVASLLEMAKTDLGCSFALPPGAAGAPPDPELVNVNLALSGARGPTTLVRVKGYEACARSEGWYYDDPAAPTTVLLCPASCNDVKADLEADLEIIMGCPTVLL